MTKIKQKAQMRSEPNLPAKSSIERHSLSIIPEPSSLSDNISTYTMHIIQIYTTYQHMQDIYMNIHYICHITYTSNTYIYPTYKCQHISHNANQYTPIIHTNNPAYQHAPHIQRLYTIPDPSSLSDSAYINPAGCRMKSNSLVYLTRQGLVQEINTGTSEFLNFVHSIRRLVIQTHVR